MYKKILTLIFLVIVLTGCVVERPASVSTITPLEVTATARATNDSGAAATISAAGTPVSVVEVDSGRNDDGTYYLGSPDAPVTFIDYSDFL